MSPPPTILSLKSDFLTTQTRTLSQPLAPSRTFLSSSQNDNDSATQDQHIIPQKLLTEALTKLNHLLTQHSRRAYPPVATRHVAEQIDKLYFSSVTSTSTAATSTSAFSSSAATSALAKNGQGGEDVEADENEDAQSWSRVNADLTSPRLISLIPDSWSSISQKEAEEYPMKARRFEELVARLKELDGQKRKVLERVARLRKIRGLVEGFESNPSGAEDLNAVDVGGDAEGERETEEGAGRGQEQGGGMKAVQENLVTKNGEMEAELQRMRVLLARVGGRVEKLDKERAEKEKEKGSGRRKRAREGEDGDGAGDERKKVEKLLESF